MDSPNLKKDKNAKTLSFHITNNTTLIKRSIYSRLKEYLSDYTMVRVSIHSESSELTQSMLIAITDKAIIKQHKNISKDKIYHIVEGIVEFNLHNNKTILVHENEIFKLGKDTFSSMKSISNVAIYNEIISGPFDQNDTIYLKESQK